MGRISTDEFKVRTITSASDAIQFRCDSIHDGAKMLLHSDLTDQILKSYYHVYNRLGVGFLEKVYENAIVHSLMQSGLSVESQKPINVHFEGVRVGEYFADVVVNGLVIIELKAIKELATTHEAQLVNYLKSTRIEVGLLLNFGAEKPEFKRKVLTNNNKQNLLPKR